MSPILRDYFNRWSPKSWTKCSQKTFCEHLDVLQTFAGVIHRSKVMISVYNIQEQEEGAQLMMVY